MRILLTNDDGYHAPGFAVLETDRRGSFSDDVWVCAPAEEQSGAGHSLTLNSPVRLRQFGERRFAVSGTPTDSVMMALREVMDGPPDLILSGVNRGANLGDDVTYSGTVSAAIEGALAGIRSIALSQVYAREGMADTVPFEAAQWNGDKKANRPAAGCPVCGPHAGECELPALCPADQVKGIRVVRQGFHDYSRGRMWSRGRIHAAIAISGSA